MLTPPVLLPHLLGGAAPPQPADHRARAPTQGSARRGCRAACRGSRRVPAHSPLRSSRSHTVTMGRECLRWWISHRDRVCTLCCELLNSDSFFSSAASEKADIPPTPRSRRPARWGRRGGEFRRPRRGLAPSPHPSPRPHRRRRLLRARPQTSKMAAGRQ